MTNPADKATQLGQAISEALNCAACVVLGPGNLPGHEVDARDLAEGASTALEHLVAVLDGLDTARASGPAETDLPGLRREAKELLPLVRDWDGTEPAPQAITSGFARLLSTFGVSEEQLGAISAERTREGDV